MPLIPEAHKKFERLKAESSARNGSLKSGAAVAKALNISEGRVSQLFGPNAGARTAISSELLGMFVRIFELDGVPITIGGLQADYRSFEETLAKASPSCTSALSISFSKSPDPTTLPSKDWIIEHPDAKTELAIVNLHPPCPQNSNPGSYYLYVSLRFGAAKYSSEEHTISVGVSKASLKFKSPGYHFAHSSLLGDSSRPRVGIDAVSWGITVTPPPGASALMGNPLGDDYLAIIEPHLGEQEVAISLETERGSGLVFVKYDAETGAATPPPSRTKNAILNLIFGEAIAKSREPTAGWLVLARAVMHRRSSE